MLISSANVEIVTRIGKTISKFKNKFKNQG